MTSANDFEEEKGQRNPVLELVEFRKAGSEGPFHGACSCQIAHVNLIMQARLGAAGPAE